MLCKPHDFDPTRRYPVIEYIYDATNTTVVQRAFSPPPAGVSADAFPRDHIDPIALAHPGFVVWVMDGRGTEERGRDFRDVAYGGFDPIPDHVEALEQLGSERPYMDLDRVGVFGISAGGNQTLKALFGAPEFYDVAPPGPGALVLRSAGFARARSHASVLPGASEARSVGRRGRGSGGRRDGLGVTREPCTPCQSAHIMANVLTALPRSL